MQLQYCYEYVNKSCEKNTWSNSIRIPMFIFMASTILATVAGNLAVIISIAHFKQLHSPTNYLILSMSTVDFLLGSFVMPYSMMRSVENCWYFGELFCKIHTSTDIMLSTASIFHLSFISVDRYYAVCDPLRYKIRMNVFNTLLMIMISWMVPAVFAFGMIFLDLNIKGSETYYYSEISCVGGCSLFFTETAGAAATIVSFFTPAFIMICVYGKIYIIARRQARSIKDATNQLHFQITLGGRQHFSRSKERKAAKTLGIIMGVFLICWSPFFFSLAINAFHNGMIQPIVIDAFVWIGYLNSTFNPMVYAFFYAWFRRALKLILCGKVFHIDSSRIILYSE
ncbi:trace amine-associated receptor 1-like [Spea bombifrons]|uniref:trace amine-associated receptor 1-like n=1 Tax=Spea bombifrons TaxID=233779 RepID=UPI00234B814F|nr:trace amine-associated receptor 1-like [Spea bombifrons]